MTLQFRKVLSTTLVILVCASVYLLGLDGCERQSTGPATQATVPTTQPPPSTNAGTPVTSFAPQKGILRIEEPKAGTSFISDTPISISGTHTLPTTAHVWFFLRDAYGYYLQNPPAELLATGKWSQDNIRPRTGIKMIIAVRVDDKGHQMLLGWVASALWGQIPAATVQSLGGYEELDRVSIVTPNP
jgi:hypothetical protein